MAWSLPPSAARMSVEAMIGKGSSAGRSKWVGTDLSRGSRGMPLGILAQVDREAAEPQAGRDLRRRLPAVELGLRPVEEPPRRPPR